MVKSFRLIHGGETLKPIVTCPECGGVAFIDARHTMHRSGKKISAGMKAKACLTCIANGKVTLI